MFFFWGTLAWIVGVAIKIIFTRLFHKMVFETVRDIFPAYLVDPLLWLYIGLLTGIFECGAVLGFAYIKRIRSANWKDTVGFGIGFGAIETFLLGAVAFISILLAILIPVALSPRTLEKIISRKTSLLLIPTPIIILSLNVS